MPARDIFITEEDFEKLSNLLRAVGQSSKNREHAASLAAELDSAHLVPPDEIPPDVVTMNSKVALRDLDTGEQMSFTLVFPWEANVEHQKVSVLAPLGTAVLGYRAGDSIEWVVPGRTRRLRVEHVLYQPEAARRTEG